MKRQWILIGALVLLLALTDNVGAQGVNDQPQYFVPFNDRNLWQLFSEVNRCQAPGYGDVSNTLESVVSLTAIADGTEWFYDHWEDGYDADPLIPGPTTETGVLNAGQTQFFAQTVDTTDLGNPDNLQYDGRDRITLDGEPAAVARLVYPTVVEGNPGVVLATAWEMPEVGQWGTSYIATIGEDLDFNGAFVDDFDYAGLSVMAERADTEVFYNGTPVATLGRGEVYFVDGANDGDGGGGVDSDDVITATAPIQVQSFVGGCNMSVGWSSQGYTLEPVSDWDNDYWAPVPDFTDGIGDCSIDLDEELDDRDVDIYIHNPEGTDTTVTLNIPGSAYDGRTISVRAHSTQSVLGATGWGDLPPDADNTQAITLTSDADFWALSMVDSSTAGVNEPRVNDWGYSLIPQSELSSGFVIGWGPGNNDDPPRNNGNLAFVTAITDTHVYVDLDQDGTDDAFDMNGDGDADDSGVYGIAAFDETASAAGVPLGAGQVLRVGDPGDRDLGGALIYTRDLCHKIAVAWGQDACASGRADPYLDHGYTPLAVVIPTMSKEDALAIDADVSGSVSPGDTLTYTVTVRNNGFGPVSNVVLTDTLPYEYVDFVLGSITPDLPYMDPPGIEYDDGSETFGYTPTGASGTTDEAITAFQLTWNSLAGQQTVTVTFRVELQHDIDVPEIENRAETTGDCSARVEVGVRTPVSLPLDIEKACELAEDADGSGDVSPGDTLSFTITMTNTSFWTKSNVVLTDTLPYEYMDFVLGSIASTSPQDGEAYDDGSGTYTYTPVGAPGTPDANIQAFRLTWATMAPRSTTTVTFHVVVHDIPSDSAGMCNSAVVTSDDTRPVRDDGCCQLPLSISKQCTPADAGPGDTLTYTVTVRNNGFGPMTNVVLTDTLPYTYTDFLLDSIDSTQPYQSESYDDGSGTFTYTPTGAPGTLDAQVQAFRLTWNTIEEQGAVNITFRVTIPDDVNVSGAIPIPNTAEGNSDKGHDQVLNEECELVPPKPLIDIEKKCMTSDGDRVARPGETLIYTVIVRNNGFGLMTNVVLTDTLPYTYTDFLLDSIDSTQLYQSESYDDGSGTFTYTPTGTPDTPDANIQAFRLTWNTIEGQDAVTITFRVAIPDDVDVSGAIPNNAEGNSDNTDPPVQDLNEECTITLNEEYELVVIEVPEPPSLLLVSSGLAALAGYARYRRHR